MLKRLAHDFPRYAGALARRITVDPLLLEELAANQPRAGGGINMARLNGVVLEEKNMTSYGLLGLIRRERGVMGALMLAGADCEGERGGDHTIAKAQSEGGVLDGLFDTSGRAEVVGYFNDFDKDDR